MPDEARQPSIVIEMVPIHTKRLLWEMGERIVLLCLSAILQKGFFFAKKNVFRQTFKPYIECHRHGWNFANKCEIPAKRIKRRR